MTWTEYFNYKIKQ